MFLRPKETLRFSIYSLKRSIRFPNSRNFHLTQCTSLRKVPSSRRKPSNVQEYENSPSVAGEFPVTVEPKNVNENFFGIDGDVGVIQIRNKPSLDNKVKKQILSIAEQEKLITTTYGTVRYDSQNKPKHHGHLEKEKILINSIAERHKIRNLSHSLQNKITLDNKSDSFKIEKNTETISVMLEKSQESPSSSYVDELYFPEHSTKKENSTISAVETTPTSHNNDKLNSIKESNLIDNTITESSFDTTNVTSDNSHINKSYFSLHASPTNPSCSYVDELYFPEPYAEKDTYNSPCLEASSTNDIKVNFIEDSYFNDKTNVETIFKNTDIVSKYSSDNPSLLAYEKIVDPMERNSTMSPTPVKIEEFQKNLFINEPESSKSNFQVSDQDVAVNNTISSLVQEAEINLKPPYEINENVENNKMDDNGGKLSVQWDNLSLEDFEGYNKFLPDATPLPKKKNDFRFQSKDFLKEKELKDSSSSRFKKNSNQTRLSGNEQDEKTQKIETVAKITQKSLNANVKNTNEEPETAYDFVKKLRSTNRKSDPELINGKFMQKTELYDSKGFRILKNQVSDLKYHTRDEILDLLTKNILYSDDDLIILNKPYNLVMHESKTTKDPCLSQYLEDLAAELDKKTYKPKLITVHRLDKETCGCLLLARNEISAQRLLSLFSQRKIFKTYWIVTTKVPEPLEGIIDMPISEGFVGGRARMVLHPNLPKDIPYKSHSKSGKRAVTQYKVIAESGNAALVEVKPETGIKHQIRVHFGFGLSCPILGDHKYSHLDKLAPQKLQSDLLQRLHVRQSKVRHIPMHIYARSIFIPQYRDGRNLFVMAPMPLHMSKNLQKLKFRKN